MPASGSSAKHVFRSVFGAVQWSAPGWLLRLKQSAKSHPGRFWGTTLLVLVLLAGLVAGYSYYQQLPKPLLVTAEISDPKLGHYQDDIEQPTALQLSFHYDFAAAGDVAMPEPEPEPLPTPRNTNTSSGTSMPAPVLSAARLDLIGEVLSDGVTISPAVAGKWLWQDDNTLTFTPDSAWPAGQQYTVKLDKRIFNREIKLAQQQYRFETVPLTAEINRLRFYQDPENPANRQVVATLNFSHPVELTAVEQQLSMLMRPDGELGSTEPQALPFSLTADKSGRELYVQSANLTLPAQEQYLTLKLRAGVKAAQGDGKTTDATEAQLLVPDKGSFLKVSELNTDIVPNPQQQPEQMLLLSLTDRINRSELQNKLKLYVLPKHPRRKSNYWSPGEVNSTVLQQASLVDFELMATALAHDNAFSIKLDLPPGQYVFVSVPAGLQSVSNFTLANEYRAVVQAPVYPKEAKIVGEGAMLTLSGEQKLQLLSRGVKGVRVKLHKLLPEQLNHLITQTGGDISQPYFQHYQFNENNITSLQQHTYTVNNVAPKETSYQALALTPYLQQAGMGLFFIELSEFDPAEPEREGQQLDRRLVLVTDLGLLVKHNSDSSQQLFVLSLADGKPVAGAEVALLGRNGVPLFSATTNNRGTVSFGKTDGLQREQQPVVYRVSRNRDGIVDSSFIPFDRYSRQLDYSKFNTSGQYQGPEDSKSLTAYMFSDRGIYRPGEQVKLAAIIRHSDLTAAASELPLKIQVQGPRGNTFWQQNFNLSGRGMHSFSLDTQAQSDTGKYHASISLLDSKGNTQRHLGSVSFAVEEFQPDTMKISSQFKQGAELVTEKGWLKPADLTVQVQLDNLFGTPAQQRRVSARLELIPRNFNFQQYPDYQVLSPQQANVKAERVEKQLDEQQTDADGRAKFALGLEQYSGGTYQLVVTTEGFDAGGGRSVQHRLSSLLSPLTHVVAVKADGELGYLKKQQQRNVNFIAIDRALSQVSLNDLSLQLIEKRPVTSLVKQDDGTYQYQSIVQDIMLGQTPFSIDQNGSDYPLPTDTAGDFELQLADSNGTMLGSLAFSVVGEGNVAAMLEKNAALTVKLDKADYKAGQWIELNITAPYTGSGLISIESDKVHAFSWFSANTTSSIQRIQLPAGLEGNAYINVSFVRAADSEALFVSPLSYAVVPFNIDRSSRQLSITLQAPAEVRPGKVFNVSYQTSQPADLLLYGVDEGILQVADYRLPDPLGHFLQKKALQVRSMQMLDLILPEFSLLQRQLAGIGGDDRERMAMSADMMLAKNLNPFARRAEQPGVFWLGVVKAGPTLQQQQVEVPASFSGNLKLMAVAVSDTALGAESTDIQVRGPFVLTPEVLQSAAPGDEFEVNISVANGVKGSGENAEILVNLALPEGLTALSPLEQHLSISEGSEHSARFRLKAGNTPGAVELRFSARYQQAELLEESSRQVSLSIRPATHYQTTLNAGYSSNTPVILNTRYPLYSEFANLNVAASANPLVLAESFTDYLANYPHGCTEQVVSQVFPWLGLVQQPGYQARLPMVQQQFAVLIQKLSERQQSDGGFSFWPGGYNTADFPSIYVMHFLMAAREQGLDVPDYLYRQGLSFLQDVARQSGGNVYQARLRANAIYLLTRSGEVTTNYLVELHERLQQQHQQAWQTDITAIYMAASYQLLQQPEVARGLIGDYRLGKVSPIQQAYLQRIANPLPPFANPAFQPQLSLDAQYVYLLARHFPEQAKALDGDNIVKLLQPVFDNQYNTIGSSYAVLALAAYAQLDTVSNAAVPQFYQQSADGKRTLLHAADNRSSLSRLAFGANAEKLIIEGDSALFYAISESGFAKTPPATKQAEQLEVVRDYLNSKGEVVSQARQGEELTVRLRLRSTSNNWHNNVAVVDLLPAGFSVVRSSVTREQGRWRADYIDIREDRLVYYATFGPQMTELRYQVKVTAAGDFMVPAVAAQSMYDRSVYAHTPAARFVVETAR
ncbi:MULTISPECIES: alpha-2-macroglobulin [unclassified Arsukibacterium]|uniref:alpha-2-macroglobulin n=1 Tax=unclassified Arsukibacterium TaxID=2635278 RepID=UPI0025C47766|nr:MULTISPECIES: alpha-2-macroglobulin [unclassified Arsukibacterium]|tara:strand:+ start:9016 stop:14934 length:5919 start_codon:yes stop_codon:yes gene_type:complete